jgi:hypothetical protein
VVAIATAAAPQRALQACSQREHCLPRRAWVTVVVAAVQLGVLLAGVLTLVVRVSSHICMCVYGGVYACYVVRSTVEAVEGRKLSQRAAPGVVVCCCLALGQSELPAVSVLLQDITLSVCLLTYTSNQFV